MAPQSFNSFVDLSTELKEFESTVKDSFENCVLYLATINRLGDTYCHIAMIMQLKDWYKFCAKKQKQNTINKKARSPAQVNRKNVQTLTHLLSQRKLLIRYRICEN